MSKENTKNIIPQKMKFEIEEDFYIVGDFWGKKNKPLVVLLHGGGQTRNSWGDTAKYLAEVGWSTLALDARGHGDSSWSLKGEYTIEFLVKDLEVVLSHFEQKPVIVGASMGGLTALVLEGEGKATLSEALVLVDIAPKVEQKGIERIFKFMSANLDGFDSLDQVADAVASYLPHRPKPKTMERLKKNLRVGEDGKYYWHWDPKMLEIWQKTTGGNLETYAERLMNAAKNLTIPTLIVRGGMSDVVSQQVMEEFLGEVPHVRTVDVSDAGHMIAGDSNHAFSKEVIQFLKEVYPAQPD